MVVKSDVALACAGSSISIEVRKGHRLYDNYTASQLPPPTELAAAAESLAIAPQVSVSPGSPWPIGTAQPVGDPRSSLGACPAYSSSPAPYIGGDAKRTPSATREVAKIVRGAQIDIPTTSPTYHLSERLDQRALRRLMEMFDTRRSYSLSSSPDTILSRSTSVDTCWPLLGHHGTVGIRLGSSALVAGVALETTSSAKLARSLPTRFRAWGFGGTAQDNQIPEHCLRPYTDIPTHLHGHFATRRPILLHDVRELDASLVPGNIACIADVDQILLEIWGQPEGSFTCINKIHLYVHEY
ncbi:unnamed protein product [Peniophora sp. CBMAI 1063]|nr:unnamed protein product [Peniophora sp. CBMAI 1063]